MHKEKIIELLEIKKNRLEEYYRQEIEMLSKKGVKSYTIGTRGVSRYDIGLRDIRAAIKQLEYEIETLEAMIAGVGRGRTLGVVPRDF